MLGVCVWERMCVSVCVCVCVCAHRTACAHYNLVRNHVRCVWERMYVCVFVCVCDTKDCMCALQFRAEWIMLGLCVRERMCVCVCECVCVCVCVCMHTGLHTGITISRGIRLNVCERDRMCVCVRVSFCVCVCVCLCLWDTHLFFVHRPILRFGHLCVLKTWTLNNDVFHQIGICADSVPLSACSVTFGFVHLYIFLFC